MSEHGQRFIQHLQRLAKDNRGGMAALRHALAFPPGTYPKAFPLVEPFVGTDWHSNDPRRKALYAVASLYATHPEANTDSFARAFARVFRKREESPSIEKRFIALLGADPENILDYLRPAVQLLSSEGVGFDYVRLFDDLSIWLRSRAEPERLDRLRQAWARDFYQFPPAFTSTVEGPSE